MTDGIVYGYFRTVSKQGKKILKSKWFHVTPKGGTPDRIFSALETVFCQLPNIEMDVTLEPKPAKDCVF